MNSQYLEEGAKAFAIEEYRRRQQKIWDGDPAAFVVLYNLKSKKYSARPWGSKTLEKLSSSYRIMAHVGSNGSFELS